MTGSGGIMSFHFQFLLEDFFFFGWSSWIDTMVVGSWMMSGTIGGIISSIDSSETCFDCYDGDAW